MYDENNLRLMNHLGGIGIAWFMLSGSSGSMPMALLLYHTCGRPPRNKEIGDVQVEKLLVQPLGIMGSALID